MHVAAFRWGGTCLSILDQRLLPHQIQSIRCTTPVQVAEAIRSMAIRGAPAIGCCAAYGLVLAARLLTSRNRIPLQKAGQILKSARPTAVNLSWAVDRMMNKAALNSSSSPVQLASDLLMEAHAIAREDVETNQAMAEHGARLFQKGCTVLTHCNAGSLATAGVGTALGVIRALHSQHKLKKVFVDETRPYLQGARLTAWELVQDHIPHELITDNMAGHFMETEQVHGVVVGCDRVAANGDTANKIGTYSLAVLARYHKIPFYVAMPTSTLDVKVASGRSIPIEERSPREVTEWRGQQVAPSKTRARHPAFDVTPSDLITAFITEFGVIRPPYKINLNKLSRMCNRRKNLKLAS